MWSCRIGLVICNERYYDRKTLCRKGEAQREIIGLLEIPSLEKFLGFSVLKLLGVRCLGFLVSWFQKFEVSKIQCSHITNKSFHVFLTATDLIYKIFKILLDGPSVFLSAPLFSNISTSWDSRDFDIYSKSIFLKYLRDVLDFVRYPSVSKDNRYWFGGLGTGPKMPKS